MVKSKLFLLLFTYLVMAACVDRISFDTPDPKAYPVVVDGFISDQPGPYQVAFTRSYDEEAKTSQRISIAVKSVTISDNLGTWEELFPVSYGTYQTLPNGIQGVVGRVYTLRFELLDGRQYESVPDTLHATGTVDSVYYKFITEYDLNEVQKYSFDIFFNASADQVNNTHFMWKFTGTYETHIPCCTCWAFIRNSVPVVDDGQFIENGNYINVKAGTVPVTGWTFMNKVYAQVEQLSLTRRAFTFWRQVRDQKLAIGSISQPTAGRISQNFIRFGETDLSEDVFGIFYATSISAKGLYIKRTDLPSEGMIPVVQLSPATANYDPSTRPCTGFFPGSTNIMPSYWKD